MADAGRQRDRIRAACAENPIRLSRRPSQGRKANCRSADAGLLQPAPDGALAYARPHVGGTCMMQRLECLRAVYPRLGDCLVVTIMGAVAAELQSLGHRDN